MVRSAERSSQMPTTGGAFSEDGSDSSCSASEICDLSPEVQIR